MVTSTPWIWGSLIIASRRSLTTVFRGWMTAVKIEKLLFVHHLIPHESLTYSTKQKLTGMELIFFTYSSMFPQLDQVHCWLFFQVLEKKLNYFDSKLSLPLAAFPSSLNMTSLTRSRTLLAPTNSSFAMSPVRKTLANTPYMGINVSCNSLWHFVVIVPREFVTVWL